MSTEGLAGKRHLFLKLTGLVLAIGFAATAPWWRNNSVGFRAGVLTPGSAYIDNSGRMFQRCYYYLGNGLRTTGQTYGIKVGRFYLTVFRTHINPGVSSFDAQE